MHLFRSIKPGESDLPWTGVIFGVTISSIWYWCSDQVIQYVHKICIRISEKVPWFACVSNFAFKTVRMLYKNCSIWQVIVQRTLASKTMIHAKGGCIMASFLKILPMFIIIFPGMASRVLFTDRVGCADPVKCEEICGSQSGCTNVKNVFIHTETR